MANVTIELGIVLLMPAQEADEWHRRIVACYGASCLPLTSVTNSASTGQTRQASISLSRSTFPVSWLNRQI